MNKINYNAPVVLTFTIIAIVLLIIDLIIPAEISHYLAFRGSFSPTVFSDYYKLFTHVLAHANVQHIFHNLMFLLLLGPILEEKYGSREILLLICVTAFATAVCSAILNIFLVNIVGLMGASGVVFAFIILVSFTNMEKGKIPLSFIMVATIFLGKEIMQMTADDNVSQTAHIIGGIVGASYGFIINKKAGSASS